MEFSAVVGGDSPYEAWLASNLARIQSFASHPDHMDEVARLVEESAFFIE